MVVRQLIPIKIKDQHQSSILLALLGESMKLSASLLKPQYDIHKLLDIFHSVLLNGNIKYDSL